MAGVRGGTGLLAQDSPASPAHPALRLPALPRAAAVLPSFVCLHGLLTAHSFRPRSEAGPGHASRYLLLLLYFPAPRRLVFRGTRLNGLAALLHARS